MSPTACRRLGWPGSRAATHNKASRQGLARGLSPTLSAPMLTAGSLCTFVKTETAPGRRAWSSAAFPRPRTAPGSGPDCVSRSLFLSPPQPGRGPLCLVFTALASLPCSPAVRGADRTSREALPLSVCGRVSKTARSHRHEQMLWERCLETVQTVPSSAFRLLLSVAIGESRLRPWLPRLPGASVLFPSVPIIGDACPRNVCPFSPLTYSAIYLQPCRLTQVPAGFER